MLTAKKMGCAKSNMRAVSAALSVRERQAQDMAHSSAPAQAEATASRSQAQLRGSPPRQPAGISSQKGERAPAGPSSDLQPRSSTPQQSTSAASIPQGHSGDSLLLERLPPLRIRTSLSLEQEQQAARQALTRPSRHQGAGGGGDPRLSQGPWRPTSHSLISSHSPRQGPLSRIDPRLLQGPGRSEGPSPVSSPSRGQGPQANPASQQAQQQQAGQRGQSAPSAQSSGAGPSTPRRDVEDASPVKHEAGCRCPWCQQRKASTKAPWNCPNMGHKLPEDQQCVSASCPCRYGCQRPNCLKCTPIPRSTPRQGAGEASGGSSQGRGRGSGRGAGGVGGSNTQDRVHGGLDGRDRSEGSGRYSDLEKFLEKL